MSLEIDLSNKKAIAGIILLICVAALVIYLPTILAETNPEVCFVDGECQHEQRVELMNQLVPIFILSGIAIGAVVFFFMSSRLEDKTKESELIANTLIKFLNKDEKKIVQKILEGKGRVFQSEVSRIEGIGKLKSHRILRRLEDRRVIELEKHGKTNIVKLTKEISDVLVK